MICGWDKRVSDMTIPFLLYCVVPENIHTHPTEGIGNSGEDGGSQRAKNLKQCMKLNWNFRRGGVHRANPFRGGGMDIFLNYTFQM